MNDMLFYHMTRSSKNVKTGPIPVSTSPEATCPPACPLKGAGCYGNQGPLKIHWCAVSAAERGENWENFLREVRSIPAGTLWRHNQVGDLPGTADMINARELFQLVDANSAANAKGFTYTHYPMLADDVTECPEYFAGRSYQEISEVNVAMENRDLVLHANKHGFTINLSANNLAHADKLHALGIGPVAVLLPKGTTENLTTPEGRKVVVCPAATRDDVTCKTCGLCQKADRTCIVGLPAHGSAWRKVDEVAAA